MRKNPGLNRFFIGGQSSILLLLLVGCDSKQAPALKAPAHGQVAGSATSVIANPKRCVSGRVTVDQTDDSDGYQIHVMYVLAADGTDRELDKNGTIARSVDVSDRWFRGQTGGPYLRFDTCQKKLDVSFVRLSKKESEISPYEQYATDVIGHDLQKAGFSNPKKIYVAYYDGGNHCCCGAGAFPPENTGHVAVLFLRGEPPGGAMPCVEDSLAASASPGYNEFALVHEVLHTLGIVGRCAPHEVRAGHVSDSPNDLMYAGDAPWTPSVLDIGHDDYYGHGHADCIDLAKSTFLEPLAQGALAPPGWDTKTTLPLLSNTTLFESGQVWKGQYICSQSKTDLALRIHYTKGMQVGAVFDFYDPHTKSNGKYQVGGEFDPSTSRLTFSPIGWMQQPSKGWSMVGMDGKVSSDGTIYSGKITSDECGAFEVKRERAQ